MVISLKCLTRAIIGCLCVLTAIDDRLCPERPGLAVYGQALTPEASAFSVLAADLDSSDKCGAIHSGRFAPPVE